MTYMRTDTTAPGSKDWLTVRAEPSAHTTSSLYSEPRSQNGKRDLLQEGAGGGGKRRQWRE
eukprot:6196122-Pleurochrysis_carterae.AAC.3